MSATGSTMLRTVTLRTFRDARRALIGYTIGLTILTLMMGVFWPTIEEQGDQFQQLLDSYPPAMQAFFGDMSQMTTAPGFLKAELFSFMLPLVILLFAIGRSADTIAGEEERGALDTLLSHPVSRRRAYMEKAAGVALSVGAIVLVVFLGLVFIDVAFGMGVGIAGILAACTMLLLLVFAHMGVTFALAGWKGRKGLVVALAATLAVASWLLSSFGRLVEQLEPARALSLFRWYDDVNALSAGLDAWGALVLAVVAAAGLILGMLLFERRDLAVG